MTEVTASVLSLAGFALAEAVSRVCDNGAGVSLMPFSMVDHAGSRALTEYASGTSNEIVQRAKLDCERACAAGEECAFAHDVKISEAGESAGARATIVIDFQAPGMIAPARIVQRYQRAEMDGRARLIGSPAIQRYDDAIDPNQQVLVLQQVESGVRDHPASERLWRYWE